MIEFDSHQIGVLHCAIDAFGLRNQVSKATEELAELIKELCLFQSDCSVDNGRHNIEEELADVIIMVQQMLIVFDQDGSVGRQVRFKMNRLERLLMEKANE